MEKKELKEKNTPSNQEYFFTDLKGVQIISGVTAFSAVVVTVLAMLFLPARIDKTLIIYTAIFTAAFIVVYYTIPKLYLSSRLMLLPDAVFTIAITLTMYALRDFGEFYLIFFLLLIAVDAFSFRLKDFIVVILMIISALLFSNLVLARNFFTLSDLTFRLIIQIYSVIIVSVVMRFFAKEALTEKKGKEQIRRLATNTLSAIKQLRNFLDNLGSGIFALDKEGKIILANMAAVNILGWEKAIVGRNVGEVMPLYNSNKQRVDPIGRVLETRRPVSRYDLMILKEDEPVKLYLNITPIVGTEEGFQGAILLFRDITKERELEEQKLEFVAVSSHELRTPLTLIEGYLYHILNSQKLKYDRKTKEFVKKAHKGCLGLQRLIVDLLEVSRIEKNKLQMELERVDVGDVAKETVAELQPKASKANLDLTLEIRDKKLPHCLVDHPRLKEVFINLIENAIKFTPKGSVKVQVGRDGKNILASVSDTGIGMSREDQKFIFNKFYRIEGWETRKTGGSGLGLYISKSIIEKLKGKIWAESKLNKGSTFYFTIPFAQAFKKTARRDEEEEIKKFLSKL